MNWETIIVDKTGGVVTITLNRPRRLNALNGKMFEELQSCAKLFSVDDEVRVIVITGAGRAFCSGADLIDLGQEVDIDDENAVLQHLRMVGEVVKTWFYLEKPVIAAVNGLALGGGCNLALVADFVIAREDAMLGEVYTRRCLVPDMGGTYFLPRLLSLNKAKEVAMLGEQFSGREAERMGLINKAVPAEDFFPTVDEWTRKLVLGASKAISLAKKGIIHSYHMSFDEVLEHEAKAIAACFKMEDFKESINAFKEKRSPEYKGK